MFFLLSALAVAAETAATVTGTVIASAGTIGTVLETATTAVGGLVGKAAVEVVATTGIETATAATLGTIAAKGTTTALNTGIIAAGKEVADCS